MKNFALFHVPPPHIGSKLRLAQPSPTEPSTIPEAGYQPLTTTQAGKSGKRRVEASGLCGKRRFASSLLLITPTLHHSISHPGSKPRLAQKKIRFAGNTRNYAEIGGFSGLGNLLLVIRSCLPAFPYKTGPFPFFKMSKNNTLPRDSRSNANHKTTSQMVATSYACHPITTSTKIKRLSRAISVPSVPSCSNFFPHPYVSVFPSISPVFVSSL
jgi:hypothetical protein